MKFVLSSVVVLLVLGLGFLWWLGGRGLERQPTQNPTSFATRIDQPDSDSDGLKDWEEGLWGTDPANPDSDNDSTSDGEEVSSRRDPRQAGPDDSLDQVEEKLAVLVREANADKNQPAINITAEELKISAVRYRLSDLRVENPETKEKLDIYAKSLKQTIENYSQIAPVDAVRRLIDFLDNGDSADLYALTKLEQDTITTINSLVATKVPSSVAAPHLNLINNLAGLAEVIYNMKQVREEPILALESGRLYTNKYVAVIQSFNNIIEYLNS